MNEDTNEITEDQNEVVEYAEKLIHRSSENLRELVFLNDSYNPYDLIVIANEIKHGADILLEASKQMKEHI